METMYIYKFKAVRDTEEITGITVADDYSSAINNVIDYCGADYDTYELGIIAEPTMSLHSNIISAIEDEMVW